MDCNLGPPITDQLVYYKKYNFIHSSWLPIFWDISQMLCANLCMKAGGGDMENDCLFMYITTLRSFY